MTHCLVERGGGPVVWIGSVHHGGRDGASGGGRAGRRLLSSAVPNRGSHRDRHQPGGDEAGANYQPPSGA